MFYIWMFQFYWESINWNAIEKNVSFSFEWKKMKKDEIRKFNKQRKNKQSQHMKQMTNEMDIVYVYVRFY